MTIKDTLEYKQLNAEMNVYEMPGAYRALSFSLKKLKVFDKDAIYELLQAYGFTESEIKKAARDFYYHNLK